MQPIKDAIESGVLDTSWKTKKSAQEDIKYFREWCKED